MGQNMNLYKDLSCPNYEQINQDLLHWISDLNIEFADFWNPIDPRSLIKTVRSFASWLKDSDLLISSAAVTYGTNIHCCGPHIDTPPARFKLSWPIKNNKGSWNRWFEIKTACAEPPMNHWGGKIFHDPENLREIARREVLGPAIIDAGIVHDVWFDSAHPQWPRVGLQCKLFKEPSEL